MWGYRRVNTFYAQGAQGADADFLHDYIQVSIAFNETQLADRSNGKLRYRGLVQGSIDNAVSRCPLPILEASACTDVLTSKSPNLHLNQASSSVEACNVVGSGGWDMDVQYSHPRSCDERYTADI